MITNLPIEDAPRNRDGNGNPFFWMGIFGAGKKRLQCTARPEVLLWKGEGIAQI